MNIEGPSLRDLHERGIYALRQHAARVLAELSPPAPREVQNAADLIEEGVNLAANRKLDRDVAA
jgi:hypothetical protein